LQPVPIGDIYIKRISFGISMRVSLVALRVALIATGVSCVSGIHAPLVSKQAVFGLRNFAKSNLVPLVSPLALLLAISLMRITGPL